ncbi:NlpC/P60 family protein [Dorea sp. AM58-8]
MVYARAGHAVGGNGNTQLGNQGYGANYSQKRATTDLSQIKVGMLISAQYGSNTAAGNAYGHVGIYIGDGKVMDSIYSGLRTISLSDWVSQNGRGWVVCGYPWDWR